MANNVLAAQVNLSIMEGVKSSYSVDVRDCFGESVDLSSVLLKCTVIKQGVGESVDADVQWSESLMAHVLTFPELPEGRHVYEVRQQLDTGEVVPLVQGVIGTFKSFSSNPSEGDAVLAPNRTLKLFSSTGKDRLEAQWMSTAAAEGFAYKAKEYAAILEDAMPLIKKAAQFMDSFNQALRESISVINGYLWIGGENTGVELKGKDGETPRYGSDGWWYIGNERVGKARGDDGITPHITSDGFWALGSHKTNTRAEGRDGIDGAAIRRIVIDSIYDLPEKEQRGVYYYVRQEDGTFDVYVWLENAGWSLIGPANDVAALNLATDRVHGMMKFSAGAQADGAPVGWKQDDEAAAVVPLAGMAVAGTGKLGSETIIDFGAPVGFNSDNAYYVPAATTNQYGAIKLGTSDTISGGAPVGVTLQGNAIVPYASWTTAGVIKLGSSVTERAPEGYRIGIGATSNHELAFNLMVTGAIRHRKISGWRGVSSMPWLAEALETFKDESWLEEGAWFTCLFTTAQFNQSESKGLELLPATTDTLAGVYIASSLDDDREASVPTASMVKAYLEENYAVKGEFYTKDETEKKINESVGNIGGFATEDFVQDYGYSKSDIDSKLDKKVGCTSGKLNNVDVLTSSEKSEMTSFDSKTLYFIVSE